MLTSLLIRNYAIIDEVYLNFGQGLTVITGETGAGKSILLGAINLILGNRADSKVLYDSNQKCIVEANFEECDSEVIDMVKTAQIEARDREIVIRREIYSSGKSRIFLNDTPVNLQLIRSIGRKLLNVHQQFDTMEMSQSSELLNILDALMDRPDLLSEYQTKYEQWKSAKDAYERVLESRAMSDKELEFLTYQLSEVEAIPLDTIDMMQLKDEFRALENVEEIRRLAAFMLGEVSEGEHSIMERLSAISRELGNGYKLHSDLGKAFELLNNVQEELSQVEDVAQNLFENIEADEERSIELRELINKFHALEQKHRVEGIESLIVLRDQWRTDLIAHKNRTDDIIGLEKSLLEKIKSLDTVASALTIERKIQAENFASQVVSLLQPLSMPDAIIELRFEDATNPHPRGADVVSMYFNSNKGYALQKVENIASGGELSRLSLSVQSVMAERMKMPTMVFDEIDTGVSGAIATKMGEMLVQLSKNHQVINITHSPQIASHALQHYFVFKEHGKDRTITKVRRLTYHERVQEIATMLSTDPPTPIAIENAKQMLGVNY